VTYLIAPVMTSGVTWRSNTRAVIVPILVRIDDDNGDEDNDNGAAAVVIYTPGEKR